MGDSVVQSVRFEPVAAREARLMFTLAPGIPDSKLLNRTIAAAIERSARTLVTTSKPRVVTRKLQREADGSCTAPLKGVTATEVGALNAGEMAILDAVNELAGDIVRRFGVA